MYDLGEPELAWTYLLPVWGPTPLPGTYPHETHGLNLKLWLRSTGDQNLGFVGSGGSTSGVVLGSEVENCLLLPQINSQDHPEPPVTKVWNSLVHSLLATWALGQDQGVSRVLSTRGRTHLVRGASLKTGQFTQPG